MHSQKSREVLDGVHPDARRQLVHPRIQHNCEDRLVLSVVAMRLQLGSCYFTPVPDSLFTPTSTRKISEIEAADQTRYVQLRRVTRYAAQHQLASIS